MLERWHQGSTILIEHKGLQIGAGSGAMPMSVTTISPLVQRRER